MDTATIKFSHLQAELPKYIFSDRVAVINDYQLDNDLMPESSISTLQSQWKSDAGAKTCLHCARCGFFDSRTSQNYQCTQSCGATIKDFAKRLP